MNIGTCQSLSRPLVIIGLMLSLAACSVNESNAKTASESSSNINSQAHLNSAEAYQKPGAGVQLEPAQVNVASSGNMQAIAFSLLTTAAVEQLELSFGEEAGLWLQDSQAQTFTNLPANKRLQLELSVQAAENGRYYLPIFVNAVQHGQQIARSFSLIIQVGEGNASSGKNTSLDNKLERQADGELIIRLPAEEY